MNKKKKNHLTQAYTRFSQKKKTKTDILSMFLAVMPEIILRTTKLEGEPVTRKMVTSLYR